MEVGRFRIPGDAVTETFETSGGPGGQHANRSQTAVRLRLDLARSTLPADVRDTLTARFGQEVDVVAAESRSQWRNRAIARRRMIDKLEGALSESPERHPTRPTRASKNRRLADKRARSRTKRLRRRPDADD